MTNPPRTKGLDNIRGELRKVLTPTAYAATVSAIDAAIEEAIKPCENIVIQPMTCGHTIWWMDDTMTGEGYCIACKARREALEEAAKNIGYMPVEIWVETTNGDMGCVGQIQAQRVVRSLAAKEKRWTQEEKDAGNAILLSALKRCARAVGVDDDHIDGDYPAVHVEVRYDLQKKRITRLKSTLEATVEALKEMETWHIGTPEDGYFAHASECEIVQGRECDCPYPKVLEALRRAREVGVGDG